MNATLYLDPRRLSKEDVAECHRLASTESLFPYAPRAMVWLLRTASEEYQRRLRDDGVEAVMPQMDFTGWSKADLVGAVKAFCAIAMPGVERQDWALRELAYRACFACADEMGRRMKR